MTRFQVETDDLDQAIDALASMAALCGRLLAEIDAVAATVSADWSGEANSQFEALKTEWAAGAQLMNQGIQTIHTASSTSNANYQAAIAAAAKAW